MKSKCLICNRPALYTEEFCSPLCYSTDLQIKIGLLNEIAQSMAPAVAANAGGSGGGDRVRELPQALSLSITGTLVVSGSVTGSYTYFDPNNDVEGVSTFKWYRSDDTAGLNKAQISAAAEVILAISASEEDKYLVFEVTPVSTVYPYAGHTAEVYSTATASAA